MRALAPPQFNLMALASRIQPLEGELLAVQSHRASVSARLVKSFSLVAARLMGSHSRHTAIRQYSDLDMLAVLQKDEFFSCGRQVSSNTVIARLIADLKDRYPFSSVYRDVMAAAIEFGSSGLSLEIVPAKFESVTDGRPVYMIPDGQGDWMRTSPATHDREFARQHARSGSKLARVSQLLKWWKHGRGQPIAIRSFYIDMLLCACDIGVGIGKTYGMCLRDFFEVLVATGCGPVIDPCGIAGPIAPNDTAPQLEALNRAAAYALLHARSAIFAEGKRDFAEANRQWSLVFNDNY